MKKLLFIVVIASLCFACGEGEQQEMSIKTKEISLYPDDKAQIDAISGYNIVFRSENDYPATVSVNGLVSAEKVGKTIIEIASNHRVVEVPVEVMGRYNLYPDPILDWSITCSNLIERAGEPDYAPNDAVIEYHNYSDQAPRLVYLFDENHALMCALVEVYSTYSADLFSYLDERYVLDSVNEGVFIYTNAQKVEDVSLVIGVIVGADYAMVIYLEYQNSQTKSSHPVSLDFQNIRKRLRDINRLHI